MRLSPWAIGSALAGCVLITVTSCSTDDQQTEAGFGPSVSLATAAVSAYDIVKVPSITIDGNLSDWSSVAAISMADDPGNGRGALNNGASVKLAWNNTYLYAAYNVTDTELLAAQTARDHADLYKDDAVELYLDPQGDGAAATSMTTTDYQLLANVRDALGDNRGTGTPSKDETFNPSSFLAKAVTSGTLNAAGADVGYTVEIRIAWTDLGVTPAAGNFMRVDLAVDDDDTANTTTEEFDWAGLTTTYNNPSGWKDVQLVNPPPPPSAYDIVKVGSITVDGDLSDWAGVTAISMADDPGNGRGSLNNSATVKLAWNDTYLYTAYSVSDTELLAVETARDASALYKDDEVELYVDPQGDGAAATSMTATDYQLLANVLEAVGDFKGNGGGGKDAAFNAASFLAQAVANGTVNATGTDAGYTVETRVAWTDLGVTPAAGHYMRIDLAVGDRDGAAATTEEFDWAGLTSTFNNPSEWKDVKLVVDATAPAAPTSPAATAVSSSQINLSWTASPSSDVNKYRIYRGTTGVPTLLTTVSGSPYQNTGLTSGTTYKYQISAVDAAGNESPKTAEKSATTTGSGPTGRPFGPLHMPLDSLGKPGVAYSSLVLNGYAPSMLANLNQARAAGRGIFISILRNRTKHPNGTMSVDSAKAELAAWNTAVNLTPYIADGTIIAIYLTDDINAANWGGETPPMARVDSLALAAKTLWPTVTTVVRARPNQLQGRTWLWLDAAWSQYSETRDGPVQAYSDKQVVDARALNLGLVLGLNVLDGGDGSSGIYGTYADTSVNRWQMSAAEVLEYGSVFLAEPYACALMQWRWSPTYSAGLPAWQLAGIRAYDTRSDVKQSNAQLRAIANTKAPVSCRPH